MANNFSGDSNCKALWKFDNGALTTDSKGSNTLTNKNSVTANTSDYQEGDAAADFDAASNQSFSITDASLDLGFPLKSGDTNKILSVCMWFKTTTVAVTQYLYAKYDTSGNDRTFAIRIQDTNGRIAVYIGYNGGASFEAKESSIALVANRWYHLGVTFDDSDGSYKIRIWDDTALAIHSNDSGNFSNAISIGSAELCIATRTGGTTLDGLIDELVVFDSVLSTDDIDAIRAGTYSGALVAGKPSILKLVPLLRQ